LTKNNFLRKGKTVLILFTFLFSFFLVSGLDISDDSNLDNVKGVNIQIPEAPINYTLVPTVNTSEFTNCWSTAEGVKCDVVDLLTSEFTNDLNWNWLIADTSTNWLYNNTDFIFFNSSNLASIYYNGTQSILVEGVLDGGTLVDTHHQDAKYDGTSLNFSETAGSPGLDLRVNFTGVEGLNRGVMRYQTSSLSGDFPVRQLWDYGDGAWEDYPVLAENDGGFVIFTQPVFDGSTHIGDAVGNDGVVQMRLYKAGNGNINNHYYMDWIAMVKGFGTPSGEEIDPYFEQWLNNPIFNDFINVNGSGVNSSWNWINGNIGNFTTTYTDHIAEKTIGHNVVFDNNVDLGTNNIKSNSFFQIPEWKSIGGSNSIYLVDIGTGTYPTFYPSVDNQVNLGLIYGVGAIPFRFKDLRLGGNAYIDGNITTYNITTAGDLIINGVSEFNDNVTIMGYNHVDMGAGSCFPLTCKTMCSNNSGGFYGNFSAC